MLIRYSRWDGSQQLPDFDADDLLEAMADDLMADGDPRRALQRLLRFGARNRDGDRMHGLRDLLDRLRQQRQQQLDRYSMSDIIKDLQEKLQEVLETEREGIKRRVKEGHEKAERGEPNAEQLQKMLEKMAAQKQAQLDALPEDLGGAIKGLQDYDFMDPEARQKFQELLQMLQQQLLQSYFQGLQQAMQNIGPGQMQALRQMVRDLNQMLREKAEGGQPDFKGFMDKWGQLFPGAQDLDDLIEQLAQQAAQMQSLLDSMSPEQRQELEELMQSILSDEELQQELNELAMNLDELYPPHGERYPFRGDEPLTLQEAMKLMGELQELERLEKQLRSAEETADLEGLDAEELRRLLGDESAEQLEQLKRLAKLLEEAGYLERKGRKWELTPLAIRKIGQKALQDIFSALKRDRFGQHQTAYRGAGGDPSDQSKLYEFGDPFLLDLRQTLRNSLSREGPGTPLRLQPLDFEVFRTELSTHSSTVVMLDMSRSMIYRDCWNAAKKVALALDSLIRGQFPRDNLYIIGFSLYARQYEPQALPFLVLTTENYGTNMQHGLQLSRQLLGRHKGGSKQVIMITDGEPTAHLEGTRAYFDYPTTARTLQKTRAEVTRCTREGITINTFMLEDSPGLMHWVNQMTQINRGRAFYATPDRLGEYILVDYVNQKQRRVG
jgi:uncharacterized protein with von Willebrand factor type A (vWA) domain